MNLDKKGSLQEVIRKFFEKLTLPLHAAQLEAPCEDIMTLRQ